jgi:hypothetical protein
MRRGGDAVGGDCLRPLGQTPGMARAVLELAKRSRPSHDQAAVAGRRHVASGGPRVLAGIAADNSHLKC